MSNDGRVPACRGPDLSTDSDEAGPVLQVGEWIDIDLEMVLGSGACEHIMDSEDAPGYAVSDLPGSRR